MRGHFLFAIAALALTGCADSGTSTGNPAPKEDAGGDRGEDADADNGGGLAGGYCKAGAATPLELDEADEALGFSAADILAFSAGTHTERLRWNAQPDVTLAPESGETELTITVTSKGTARHVEPDASNQEGGLLIDEIGGCMAWLEVDVDVKVESSGGALDEAFEGLLRAQSPLTATIHRTFDDGELDGAFVATPSGTLEGFEVDGLSLNIAFSEYSTGGSFGGYFTKNDGLSAVGFAPAMPFASFGPGKCERGGFSVGGDDAIEGVTANDAIALFTAADEVDLTWQDGGATTSTCAFTPASAGGCVLLDNEQLGDFTIAIDGMLAMASADERLDAAWPGRIEAHIDDGGAIERVQFLIDGTLPSSTMPGAAASYGFPDEDLSSYDAASVSTNVVVTESGASGTITLTGYVYADCVTDPVPPDQPGDADPGSPGGGAPGCRGADPVIVAQGTIE